GLRQVLRGMEDGSIRTLAVDTPVPSQFSHEILNANPYAYLDDAPLEERRARGGDASRFAGVDAGRGWAARSAGDCAGAGGGVAGCARCRRIAGRAAHADCAAARCGTGGTAEGKGSVGPRVCGTGSDGAGSGGVGVG